MTMFFFFFLEIDIGLKRGVVDDSGMGDDTGYKAPFTHMQPSETERDRTGFWILLRLLRSPCGAAELVLRRRKRVEGRCGLSRSCSVARA
uniref:Putative secreted protein n=1 Tax=Ixodes ricinus TaxID=34613 RepID=A0A6B0UAI8_IXORI